jgi:hypothetical protein
MHAADQSIAPAAAPGHMEWDALTWRAPRRHIGRPIAGAWDPLRVHDALLRARGISPAGSELVASPAWVSLRELL